MGKEGNAKNSPLLLIIIVLAMMIVALVVLFSMVGEYVFHGAFNPMNMALSIGTILLSLYLLLQIIKRPKDFFLETQRVTTTIRCMNCDYVTAREFEGGDYVLKEVGVCLKCGGNLIIHSIFREVKDEERRSE
ncbi:MAG: hypothetical protein QXX99_03600 [Candidatus Bathyarchaeia archaeon]